MHRHFAACGNFFGLNDGSNFLIEGFLNKQKYIPGNLRVVHQQTMLPQDITVWCGC